MYTGCRFPADPAYAAVLARHAQAVGERLAHEGARGRLGVDFVAVRRRRQWDVLAIEVNLRRGGTTHPFTVLRSLVPGRYDVEAGAWVATADGTARFYSATDNILDPRGGPWIPRPPSTPCALPASPSTRPAAPESCCTCCRTLPSTGSSYDAARRRTFRAQPGLHIGRAAQGALPYPGQGRHHRADRQFLKLVASKRRLFAIHDMVRAYRAMVDAANGVVRAQVTVAELPFREGARRHQTGAQGCGR